MKIPFSVYDFFGYLIAGFLVLASVDYAYDDLHVLLGKPDPLVVTFWIVTAYVLGHIIAAFSSSLVESVLTCRLLGRSEELLLKDRATGLRAMVLFRGFFKPLPQPIVDAVASRARSEAGPATPGRALFFHCWSRVIKDPLEFDRLNTFLNLYGFARNVSFASLVALAIMAGRIVLNRSGTPDKLGLLIATAAFVSISLYYRYLKFYRAYTQDVFLAYSAAPHPSGGHHEGS